MNLKFNFFTQNKENKALVKYLKSVFGIKVKNISLYEEALSHKSVKQIKNLAFSNERLEFLGDSVIGLVVSHLLFTKFKNWQEGNLSKLKSKLISRDTLNNIAVKLEIPNYLDKKVNSQIENENLYGNALEAIIGACYLDLGFKQTSLIFEKILLNHVNFGQVQQNKDSYKSKLNELTQAERVTTEFVVDSITGTANNPTYLVSVLINGEPMGQGSGKSKKSAEQMAAKDALTKFGK